MIIELPKHDRKAEVEILSQEGTKYRMKIDEKIFEIDLVEVSGGIYSLLYEGESFNVEAIPGENPTKYTVNTFPQSFELEIVDAQTRYKRSRSKGAGSDTGNQIRVPMPGKVVDVLVKTGDPVKLGQTLVIVSAMKMESEYKSGRDGKVCQVLVKPGDTVDSEQIMVTLE
ncbi:MAG: biotin/lipoyl-containing protein [Bacteroidota bacterium]